MNYLRAVILATTAERFFRIDRAQEHLHYVTDISSESLYILDPELQSSNILHNGKQHAASSPNLITSAGEETVAGNGAAGNLAPPPSVVIVENSEGRNKHIAFQLPATPPKSPWWAHNSLTLNSLRVSDQLELKF